MLRIRHRLILPAAAALMLVGCVPGSSGPSIPPIPRGTQPVAAPQAEAAKPQAGKPGKRFTARTLQKTQTSPRSRPAGAE